jgi:hypothetical protein
MFSIILFGLLATGGVSATNRNPVADFDGDGKTDISVFRPENGFWYISKSSGGYSFLQWGLGTDKLVPGDYDGDGKTDLAVHRTNSDRRLGSTWYILRSSDNTYLARQFANNSPRSSDSPAPADYDGDGKTDLAVSTKSDVVGSPSNFIILQSSTDSIVTSQWGVNIDTRVVADYDGDGKEDLAVYRYPRSFTPTVVPTWYIQQSTNSAIKAEQFGLYQVLSGNVDIPAQGDYDGDGKADIAVWRVSNGFWYWISSRDKSFNSYQFGWNGDKPVPGDYDGDGKTDFAVFRPSNGTWYIQQSTKGFRAEQFGLATDIPIPNAVVGFN